MEILRCKTPVLQLRTPTELSVKNLVLSNIEFM